MRKPKPELTPAARSAQGWGRMIERFLKQARDLDRDGAFARSASEWPVRDAEIFMGNAEAIAEKFAEYRQQLESLLAERAS